MKEFRTTVSIGRSECPLDHKNAVLTIGSCFADAIGDRLKKFKFFTVVNPFGTIYNPVSIHDLLRTASKNLRVDAHTFAETQGVYVNFNFHSSFSSPEKNILEQNIANSIQHTHAFLQRTSVVVITYGSSWVYERKDTGELVANCHKIPQKNFHKRLLSIEEILTTFRNTYDTIRNIKSDVRFILTVSPVRHTKDTLELNGVSKAILRTACHMLTQELKDVEYFPAYEIMTDDLRDYRFYKADMIHPTDEAEDYIWEKFGEKYFSEDTIKFIDEWNSILSAINHRPFHPLSFSHQQFLVTSLKRIEKLAPRFDVSEEISIIKQRIVNAPGQP